MRVLHLSDVHIQIDWSQRPYRRMGWRRAIAQLEFQGAGRWRHYAKAEETLARIVAAADGVDHVILSGDLTALALDEEFERARAALGPLALDPSRFTVIPGNHDVYTAEAASSRRFERHFGHLLHSELPELTVEGMFPFVRLVGATLAVVGLRSARLPPLPGIAAGWVGQPQLDALARICLHPKLKGRAIYVTVHHAPARRDGSPDRVTHGLRDRDALLRVCREGGVAAILCGHLHHRYVAEVEGVTVVNPGSSTALGHEGYFLLRDEDGKLAEATPVSLPPA